MSDDVCSNKARLKKSQDFLQKTQDDFLLKYILQVEDLRSSFQIVGVRNICVSCIYCIKSECLAVTMRFVIG